MIKSKKERIRELLFEHGPGNGRTLLLAYDHGVEHGPSDFFENPESKDPKYILELAKEAELSGIVLHIGIAEKYWYEGYRNELPLVLKLNGKTNITPDEEPISPLVATPEDAFEFGASAVGYTLYVGSPKQDEDIRTWGNVRREAHDLDLPTIMWSYPRGRYVEQQGGRNSFAMVDYAARLALELGADFVKLNMPTQPEKYDEKGKFKKYNRTLDWSLEKMVEELVKSAGKTQVLIAGGEKKDYNEMIKEAEACLRAGVTGFVIGRNIFMREKEEAISLAKELKELIKRYPKD